MITSISSISNKVKIKINRGLKCSLNNTTFDYCGLILHIDWVCIRHWKSTEYIIYCIHRVLSNNRYNEVVDIIFLFSTKVVKRNYLGSNATLDSNDIYS